jgi:hypothetical protein
MTSIHKPNTITKTPSNLPEQLQHQNPNNSKQQMLKKKRNTKSDLREKENPNQIEKSYTTGQKAAKRKHLAATIDGPPTKPTGKHCVRGASPTSDRAPTKPTKKPCTNIGADLNHSGTEGSAAHHITTLLIYITEERFWIRRSGSKRKLERGQKKNLEKS